MKPHQRSGCAKFVNQNEDSEGRFEQSIFVLATVISANAAAGRRVLDAGNKACDLLSGMPQLVVIRTIIAGIWVAFFQECQQ